MNPADDCTTADAAYRLACEGTALLWRGDYHNARQLLQALARRVDKTPQRKQRKAAPTPDRATPTAQAFNLHRQAQAQRARVLGMVSAHEWPPTRTHGHSPVRITSLRRLAVE